jgi:hypothetical protein
LLSVSPCLILEAGNHTVPHLEKLLIRAREIHTYLHQSVGRSCLQVLWETFNEDFDGVSIGRLEELVLGEHDKSSKGVGDSYKKLLRGLSLGDIRVKTVRNTHLHAILPNGHLRRLGLATILLNYHNPCPHEGILFTISRVSDVHIIIWLSHWGNDVWVQPGTLAQRLRTMPNGDRHMVATLVASDQETLLGCIHARKVYGIHSSACCKGAKEGLCLLAMANDLALVRAQKVEGSRGLEGSSQNLIL